MIAPDIFPEPRHKLIEGDYLKLFPAMAEFSVVVVWTEPPYLLNNGGSI